MTKSNRIESLINFYEEFNHGYIKVASKCFECKSIKFINKFKKAGSKRCISCCGKQYNEKRKKAKIVNLQKVLSYKQDIHDASMRLVMLNT